VSRRELAAPGPELSSALAHELRTPLVAVVGYSRLLSRHDDEPTREAAEKVVEAAARLSAALDHVLAALAIDAGGVELEIAPLAPGAPFRGLAADPPPERWPLVIADEESFDRAAAILLAEAQLMGLARASAAARDGELVVRLEHAAATSKPTLALYVARRLLELNGGAAWHEEPAGGMPALCFSLPLAALSDK